MSVFTHQHGFRKAGASAQHLNMSLTEVYTYVTY